MKKERIYVLQETYLKPLSCPYFCFFFLKKKAWKIESIFTFSKLRKRNFKYFFSFRDWIESQYGLRRYSFCEKLWFKISQEKISTTVFYLGTGFLSQFVKAMVPSVKVAGRRQPSHVEYCVCIVIIMASIWK